MFSVVAAQLIAIKGLVARGLARWMRRASTSLPVPDSPTISTEQSVAATRRARSMMRRDELSTATGSSASLKFFSVLIWLDSSDSALWAEGGHGLQLQLPCLPFRVMRITRVTAIRRWGMGTFLICCKRG